MSDDGAGGPRRWNVIVHWLDKDWYFEVGYVEALTIEGARRAYEQKFKYFLSESRPGSLVRVEKVSTTEKAKGAA